MDEYPPSYEVRTVTRALNHVCRVPGSKSITNRALVLAALKPWEDPVIHRALRSEDTEIMIACLKDLGFDVRPDWDTNEIMVGHDSDRLIPKCEADLYVGNSGTTMRFLAAMVSLAAGRYRFDGVARMRERPMHDLLDALRQLGVRASCEFNNGCPPVVIESDGWQSGQVSVGGRVSSQYVSGLIMAAAFAPIPVTIRIDGELVSEPYVAMTYHMILGWTGNISNPEPGLYQTTPQHLYAPQHYYVEPDASAASYFFAAAAICRGMTTVPGMKHEMLQGDVKFVDCLASMGCAIEYYEDGIRVVGGPLCGIDVDMNAISDTVMTLAAVACFAEGPTTIRNVAHIRHKETDRIAAVATELRKLGVEVEEFADGLTITPRPMTGCALDTYDDHRMAMSLALIGLKVPGVIINNPGCVAKTYPGFWTDFEKLYL